MEGSRSRELAIAAARVADHEHGTDVQVLEVAGVTIVADYFVIVSASNKRLSRRITEEVEAKITETMGEKPVRREGIGSFDWVVIDYGDVMVHVFSDETREFYEIERLYADVPSVDWGGPEDEDRGPDT